jgi:hypothetical protein
MGKNSGSGSGMNNPNHISESLETIFLELKYLNSLMRIREPGWKKNRIRPGMEKIWIRDKHPDPQHCKKRKFVVRGGECPTVKYLK